VRSADSEKKDFLDTVSVEMATPAGSTSAGVKSQGLARLAVIAASAARHHGAQLKFERKEERETKSGSHIFRK